MKRLLPGSGLALALLAIPAAAQAKPQTAAVLRVDRAHRSVELVDSQRVVRNYTLAGSAPRKLRAGARVAFQAHGKRISALRVEGRARKLSSTRRS
jgi:hypothetical protein